MKDLAIAIPSRNRALVGETFYRLLDLDARYGLKGVKAIYVYVDAREKDFYSKILPEDFTIIAHNEKTIGRIRLFIQKHQHELGNNALMLDDDLLMFARNGAEVKINRIIKETRDSLAMNDFVYFQEEEGKIKTAGAAVALSPGLYAAGIRYSDARASEDLDFFIQVLAHGVKTERLNYRIIPSFDNPSNFYPLTRNMEFIRAYEKYGELLSMVSFNGHLMVDEIRVSELDGVRKNKIAYSEKTKELIKRVKILKGMEDEGN